MKRAIKYLLIAANIIIGLCLLAGAFGGYSDPHTLPHIPLFVLAFPISVFAMLIVLICDYIWLRQWAVFAVFALMLAFPEIMQVFPANYNFGTKTEKTSNKTFSIMTYNVFSFVNVEGYYPLNHNATLDEILRANPDIACLQETYAFERMDATQVSGCQLDSVHIQYPYVMFNSHAAITILSKFPIKPLELPRDYPDASRHIAAYKVDIDGTPLSLFVVHLASIRLQGKERTRYGRSTLGKIAGAGIARAEQADFLKNIIEQTATTGDVIVCGDFNDVPGCYTIRQLQSLGMQSVNATVGKGYLPTYNAYRLLVNIDHIFYRGNLSPLHIQRGQVRNSDHYSLMADFLLNNE